MIAAAIRRGGDRRAVKTTPGALCPIPTTMATSADRVLVSRRPSTGWTARTTTTAMSGAHHGGRTVLAQDSFQAPVDRRREGVADVALLEALDELGHEALDHEPLGGRLAQAAR